MKSLCKPYSRRNIIFLAVFLLLPFLLITPAEGENMELIRLHVIANSDSEYDQYVKLRVRDSVLEVSKSLEPDEIKYSLGLMEDAAKTTLYSYGCDYPVKAVFGEFDFPTKSYGNVTLPAGKYTAVRVIIGDGAGQNWWCVMYPPLCFTDETNAHFDSDLLPSSSGSPKFKIKLKLLELFE